VLNNHCVFIKNAVGMIVKPSINKGCSPWCHRLENLPVWLAGNPKFRLSFNEGSTLNCHYYFVIYDNLIILSEMKII